MAYNDEQKKQALEKKENRAIAFEVMEELRLLTALSIRNLITHINAARKEIKPTDDETVYDFDPRSRSAFCRESKKEQTKQISELTAAPLKEDSAQLRIRIIEIPIYYGKNQEQRCEPEEIESYEILRWLFCYEIQTGYLSYIAIPRHKYPTTLKFIMDYVKSIQTELKMPFSNVIFTQELLNYRQNDSRQFSWDWVSSSILNRSNVDSYLQKLTNIEQLDLPTRKHDFSLNGKEEKRKFMRTVRQLVDKHKSNVSKSMKTIYSTAYEEFTQELKAAESNGEDHTWWNTGNGNSRILFNSIVSDKKFKKLQEEIEKEAEIEHLKIMNNLKRFI